MDQEKKRRKRDPKKCLLTIVTPRIPREMPMGGLCVGGAEKHPACFPESCPGGGIRGPVAVALGRVVRDVGTGGAVDLSVSQRACGSLCIFVA